MERRSKTLLSSYFDLLQRDAPAERVLLDFGKKLVGTLLYPETWLLYRLAVAEAVVFPEIAQKFWQMGPGQALEQLKEYLVAQVQGGLLAIPNIEYAAEQFHGALIGGLNIRMALEIPTFLLTEDETETWVKSTVGVFLRAYRPEV